MSRPRKMICVVVFFWGGDDANSGVCSKHRSLHIRHLSLFTMHLRKMLDFSVLLSKVLYAFTFVVF